jgi:hypothetical protein
MAANRRAFIAGGSHSGGSVAAPQGPLLQLSAWQWVRQVARDNVYNVDASEAFRSRGDRSTSKEGHPC